MMSDLHYALADATYGQYVPVWLGALNCAGTERDPLPAFACTNTISGKPRLLGITQRSGTTGAMLPVRTQGWSYCSLQQPALGWSEAVVGSYWDRDQQTAYMPGVLVPEGPMKLLGWKTIPAAGDSYAIGIVELTNAYSSGGRIIVVRNTTTIGEGNPGDNYAVPALTAAQIVDFNSATGIYDVKLPYYAWNSSRLAVCLHRIASGAYGYAIQSGECECRGAIYAGGTTLPQNAPLYHGMRLTKGNRTVSGIVYHRVSLGAPYGCVYVNGELYHTVVWGGGWCVPNSHGAMVKIGTSAYFLYDRCGAVNLHAAWIDGVIWPVQTIYMSSSDVTRAHLYGHPWSNYTHAGGIWAASTTQLAPGVIQINA